MADTSSKGRPAGTQSARGTGQASDVAAAPAPGPQPSAAPPGQAPEAAATSEAAAAPPADHAADPAPPAPGQDSQPAGAASPDQPAAPPPGSEPATAGGDTAVQTETGPVTAAGGQVRGGRLADLGQAPAMPEGVPYAVALEALYVGNPDAAAAAARAFNPGDRVPAELVEKFGWHDLVQIPEWAAAPPAPATETSEEQK